MFQGHWATCSACAEVSIKLGICLTGNEMSQAPDPGSDIRILYSDKCRDLFHHWLSYRSISLEIQIRTGLLDSKALKASV